MLESDLKFVMITCNIGKIGKFLVIDLNWFIFRVKERITGSHQSNPLVDHFLIYHRGLDRNFYLPEDANVTVLINIFQLMEVQQGPFYFFRVLSNN